MVVIAEEEARARARAEPQAEPAEAAEPQGQDGKAVDEEPEVCSLRPFGLPHDGFTENLEKRQNGPRDEMGRTTS